MDFGQYTKEQVFNTLKSKKGSGVCERCGTKTRTNSVFGMTLCPSCWKKQTSIGG